MEKIFLNAEGLVLGRMASFTAQKALQGSEIKIANAEKVIISGTKESAIKKFERWIYMRGKGNPEKGTQYSRMPDKIVKTAIRKMLPKTSRGKTALARVKVFIGTPKEFEEKNFSEIADAKPKNPKNFQVLGEICKLLGAKVQ